MITISINQEVMSNRNYITCMEGDYDQYSYILCKRKDENIENTVMFLAIQINNIDYESSI
jgi:hypothetical protein